MHIEIVFSPYFKMVFREENGCTVEVPFYPKNIQERFADLPFMTVKDIELCKTEDSCCVIINNLVFEVSTFLKTHPGGSLVLLNSGGKNVTDAFENYHNASTHKKLDKFLIGKVVVENTPEHVIAFRNLRQQMLRKNMFHTNHFYYCKLALCLLSLFTVSLYLSCGMMDAFSRNMRLVGACLLGFFWQQLSGIGHDLGHTSITHIFKVDHLVGSLLISVLGLSIGWWKIDHNNHHVNTNSIENDPNIQHLPLLATSTRILKGFYDRYHQKQVSIDSLTKQIISSQHLFVYPLILLGRFNLYFQQIMFMYTRYDKHNFWRTEMCGFSIFCIWYLSLAFSQPNTIFAFYWILVSHITSGILHVQIVISHWAMEKYVSIPEDDWYLQQLKTTMNIKTNEWLDFIHVGLQFQIEHHMYPRIPRHHLRIVRKMVKDICKRHDLHHLELTFFNANVCTWKNLKTIANSAKL